MIYIEQDDKTINNKFEGKIEDLLKQLKINSQTVVIVKNREIVTEKESVKDTDELKLLSVVSGG